MSLLLGIRIYKNTKNTEKIAVFVDAGATQGVKYRYPGLPICCSAEQLFSFCKEPIARLGLKNVGQSASTCGSWVMKPSTCESLAFTVTAGTQGTGFVL